MKFFSTIVRSIIGVVILWVIFRSVFPSATRVWEASPFLFFVAILIAFLIPLPRCLQNSD
jgi:hypothetical protein